MAIIATTAKASLTSKRSTSSDLPASALERPPHRRDRGGGELAGRVGVRGGVGDHPRHRLQAEALGRGGAHHHQRREAAPSEIEAAFAAGDRPVLGEGRAQGRDFRRIGLQRLLVGRDALYALAARNVDSDDLAGEGAALDTARRARFRLSTA